VALLAWAYCRNGYPAVKDTIPVATFHYVLNSTRQMLALGKQGCALHDCLFQMHALLLAAPTAFRSSMHTQC
jgi:hypothetical protein